MMIDPRLKAVRLKGLRLQRAGEDAVSRTFRRIHDADPAAHHGRRRVDEAHCRICIEDLSKLRRQLAEGEDPPQLTGIQQMFKMLRGENE